MKIVAIIFFLLITVGANAQKEKLTIQDLLERVKNNYPLIKAKQASLNAANYNIKAAQKDYLPDLIVADQYQYSTNNGLEGSYYSNEGSSISTSGGIRSNNIYQPVFGSFTTLMVNWHAFDFGKVRESVKLAEAKADLAKADYNDEIFRIQVRVADAYMLYLLSLKLVDVQENNLARTQAFQQYIISHARSGLIPGVDSSSANAEVASVQLALLQSRQYVALQKNNLEQLINVPVDSIRVDTATFLKHIPTSQLELNQNIYGHPSILLAQQQFNTQLTELNGLKKAALPTINILGATWARGSGVNRLTKNYSSSPADGLPFQTYNYLLGVAVKWNITSLAKNKQQYLGGIQQLEATRYRIDEETSQLEKEVKNAKLQFESAREQARVTPIQYQAALDAFNLSNARYKAGLSSLNEVVQAYYVLSRAEIDEAVSINNMWRAVLQYSAATGNFSSFTSLLP